MQLNKVFNEYEPSFIKMIKQYESMQVGHPTKITVAKQWIVLSLLDAPPVRLAPYRAVPKQRKLEH